MNVGVVGLGVMGRPMAERLLNAGLSVTVYARTAARAASLVERGAHPVPTAAAVARVADVIIVIVPDTSDMRAVMLGPTGLLEGAREGQVIAAMGTHDPLVMPELAALAAERGVRFIDAPVSGGEVGARDGSLSIMVGGEEDAYHAARPILALLGQRVVHVGPSGAGQAMKACNQLVVGSTIQAVAEALTLGRRLGLDPIRIREVLGGGFAESRVLAEHGQRMIDGNFQPGGRVRLHAKDARIVMDLADRVGLPLPGFEPVARAFDRLVDLGSGDLDHSALVTLLDQPAANPADSPPGSDIDA